MPAGQKSAAAGLRRGWFVAVVGALVACVGAPPAPPSAAPTPPESDLAATIVDLRAQCNRGEGMACVTLGLIRSAFAEGASASAGPLLDRGVALMTRQCNRSPNDQRRCAALSLAHLIRAGVADGEGQTADALSQLQQLCQRGTRMACYLLVDILLRTGRGQRAQQIMTESCEQKDVEMCSFLAHALVDEGAGMAPDSKRAAELADHACQHGSAAACSLVGIFWRDGMERAVDRSQAVRYFQLACVRGDGFGCLALGNLREAEAEGSTDAYQKAAALYQRACETDEVRGCTQLGRLMGAGLGMPPDDARAAQLFERGCDHQDVRGCLLLGLYLLTGRGVAPDETRANDLLRRACAGGEPDACDVLSAPSNESADAPGERDVGPEP